MPTPGDSGMAKNVQLTPQFFLEVLDAKFAKQEALIRELLEHKPHSWHSNANQLCFEQPKEQVVEVSDFDSPDEESKLESHMDTSAHAVSKVTRAGRLGLQVMSEKLEPDPPMKAFVKGPLDGYMGIVVLVNLIFMILETQWTAANADSMLNVGPPPEWGIGETFFQVAEYVFFSTYAIDVLVRIIILRSEWYYDKREGIMFLNVFDACVVAVNAVELLLLPLLVLGSDPDQVNSIRVIKLFRIARTLRIVKTVQLFRQLRLLVGTCIASIGALFWSMILLMVMKVGFALIICQALQGVVMDPGTEESTRIEVNRLYGSFLKALYTMFEITHSGSWPAVVRPIVEQVDAWYAVLFLAYITLVVFAVIRIVTALFLKETLASAANDADMVMEDNRRSAVEANMKLQELFHAADDDGDGHLSPDEFV